MREIRFHGRGGQGVVMASRIMAVAGCSEGLFVQAFPMFGAERAGAPVTAFLRLDRDPIWMRCQVQQPDIVAVLDPTLIGVIDITAGLKADGDVVVNGTVRPAGLNDKYRCHLVDASHIAARHGLGSPTAPLVSTALLGALGRVLGSIRLKTILDAVKRESPSRQTENVAAAKEGYESVILAGEEVLR